MIIGTSREELPYALRRAYMVVKTNYPQRLEEQQPAPHPTLDLPLNCGYRRGDNLAKLLADVQEARRRNTTRPELEAPDL